MCQFVSEHWLLLLGIEPIEQVHSFGLGIVVAGDLLLEQRYKKFPKIEVTRQKAKLFQYQL